MRRESPGDEQRIRLVLCAAFGTGRPDEDDPAVVRAVATLRSTSAWIPALSLVALEMPTVVGHVLGSRALVVGDQTRSVVALAPLAVLPENQRRGIGTALVHALLAAADALDEPLVGVLGDPHFYARFGFLPALSLGIVPPEPTWADHFQVRMLSAYRPDIRGSFVYADPIADLDDDGVEEVPGGAAGPR